MVNKISEILKAAREDQISTKLLLLEQQPETIYEIVEKIRMLQKKNNLEEIANIQNYDIFLSYFCFNNDTMALLQVQQMQYFDSPVDYKELYLILEEAKDYINSWTFDKHYPIIRKILDAKNEMEYITGCQQLGLPPYIIEYDIRQCFIALNNLLFYKKRVVEIQNSKNKPNQKRSEIKKYFKTVLEETLNSLYKRSDETKDFYKERHINLTQKMKCADEIIEFNDEYGLETIETIDPAWHRLLSPSVLTPIYELLLDNQSKKYKVALNNLQDNQDAINATPLIKYLYDNELDPATLTEEQIAILDKVDIEELKQKISFFQTVGFDISTIITTYIDILIKTPISTINKLYIYIEKNIIKKETIKNNLSFIDSIDIIDTNYEILKAIIDINSAYYNDSILLLNPKEIKRRLAILADYNLTINNYMFLLANINYLNIYDLLLEHNIPLYLFISICKTLNPLLTIKKIIICQELNMPYEKNGNLIKEVKKNNGFMCPNENIDEYIGNVVPNYINVELEQIPATTVKKSLVTKELDNYRNQDTYVFGNTKVSRPKVLRNLQALHDEDKNLNEYINIAILSNSIYNSVEMADIVEITSNKKMTI